jgi:hypothetical protein
MVTVLSLKALSYVAALWRRTQPKENRTTRERSFTEFRSPRSLCDFLGRLELSRVKMNALRAPFTALPVRREMCVHFFNFIYHFLIFFDFCS